MARFVDLEESDEDSSCSPAQAYTRKVIAAARTPSQPAQTENHESRPEVSDNDHASRASFAAALTCYPVALSLSSHLDLNDLHSLSLTSRSVHRSVSQYCSRLKSNSLRCTFDDQPLLSDLRKSVTSVDLTDSRSDSRDAENEIHLSQPGQLSSAYKISGCARDLVTGCRKCGTVVCRNCVAKAPSDRYLGDRHRRLCRICLDAPLSAHLQFLKEDFAVHDPPPTSSASSARSTRSSSGSSQENTALSKDTMLSISTTHNFTSQAFLRTPCVCATRGVYLCGTCGHSLRANDTTYKRVWTWRSRYSTHIGGGLGTGLGVGDQGQKCGRGDHCLSTCASSVSWVEIDCSDGSLVDHSDNEIIPGSRVGTPTGDRHDSPSPPSNKPGYLQQEIEGIGGVVKKKVKKRVKVGATVWEYDDERTSGKYLEREISGRERSWCGWCDRLCLGEHDRQVPA